MCKMYSNILIFVAAVSVLAGYAIEVEETSTKLNIVPGSATDLRNTTDANKNNSQFDHNYNDSTNKTVDDNMLTDHNKSASNNITDSNTGNNTANVPVDNNIATNNTLDSKTLNNTDINTIHNNIAVNNNTLDSNTVNNRHDSTVHNNIAANNNETAVNSTLDSKIVNNSTDNQQDATANPALNNSDAKKNDTPQTNLSSTVSDRQTMPPAAIDQHPTQANVFDTNVHNNESIRLDPNASKKENATAIDSLPPTTNTRVPKWKVILITALVVILGCCGVLIMKRSLGSERGQAFVGRTRRQANMPCRDYEVQYLVIRDSDD